MSSVLPSSEWVLWILASSFAVPGVEGDTFCATTASRLWHDLGQEVICAEIPEAGRSDYGEQLNDYKQYNFFFTVNTAESVILFYWQVSYFRPWWQVQVKIWIQICMCSSVHVSFRQDCKPGVCAGKKTNNIKVFQAHLRTMKVSTQAVQLVIKILLCLISLW